MSEESEMESFDEAEYLGVFALEGDCPRPIAMFSRLDDAQAWLAYQRVTGNLGSSYGIMKLTASGEYRNHVDNSMPEVDPPAPIAQLRSSLDACHKECVRLRQQDEKAEQFTKEMLIRCADALNFQAQHKSKQ